MKMATTIPTEPNDNLAIGSIIEVDGTHVVAELKTEIKELLRVYAGETYYIGQFGSIVKILHGPHTIYGYVSRLRMKSEYELEKGIITSSSNARVVEVDLFGEGLWETDTSTKPHKWVLKFERGVSHYPLPQQTMYLTPKNELHFIYNITGDSVLLIGEHVGSSGAPCYVDMNELLGKHTAILGSTGAGKSATVAAILHSIIDRKAERGYPKWNPKIIILDPHGEYSKSFPDCLCYSTDNASIKLPYWLFNFQESISVFIGKTEFVATSQANILKTALFESRKKGAEKLGIDITKITVDSPIPYSIKDLKKNIEDDKPTQSSKQDSHNSILQKIDKLLDDPRMKFLMEDWDKETDPASSIIGQFLGEGSPIRIIDLSGVPNEVAGIASAVISRLIFSFKLWQNIEERSSNPILIVCEEAHRYVPNRGDAQYGDAQEGIRRLAKEGRKYGIGLFLVSQRPSEVDSTVLSQCNSWIVLRITNDNDREHVKAMLPDSLSGLSRVLSSLRRREAMIVGLATMLPSRILIKELDPAKLPASQDIDFDKGWQKDTISSDKIQSVMDRWRLQMRPD
jgi:hypothetical protein